MLKPASKALQRGCCCEERLPGASGPRRCSEPVVAGKPWCVEHARLFALGKSLRGRTTFARRGLH